MHENNIISLKNAISISKDVLIEKVKITPAMAAQWLKCNNLNRPLSNSHVNFLAREMKSNNWQLNGQAIIIAENEAVLDGQHRLHAIIESGETITSLVVYGILPEAFKTIDTGKNRCGKDALCLSYPDTPIVICTAVATAVRWCFCIDNKFVQNKANEKISNTQTLKFVAENPILWRCADILNGYPKEAKPLSIGAGTALYWAFNKKHWEFAGEFMRRFYTGEALKTTDPEYVLRAALIKDAQRSNKWPARARIRMVIKAWNAARKGKKVTMSGIVPRADDNPQIEIL